MSRCRIAVIGGGHLGRIHTRLLQPRPDVELVGVAEPVAETRSRVADEFGVAVCAHHEELIDQIDAAVVATTTEFHHAVSLDLLVRGKHVLVEKPIAATVWQADEMLAAAARRGCVLQVGHVERFNPAWRAISSRVRRPRFVEAVRTSGYTFRSTDIGVVLDLMIHDLDLVLSLVRSEVVDVDAVGSTIFGPHEDMAHAHLRFANGCLANFNASRTSFYAQRTMQIVADHAYASVDFHGRTAKLIRPSKAILRGEIDVQQLSVEERERIKHNLFCHLLPVRDLVVADGNPIQDEQDDFLNCIRTGRAPRVSGQQARDCLAVAERIVHRLAPVPHVSPLGAAPRLRTDHPHRRAS